MRLVLAITAIKKGYPEKARGSTLSCCIDFVAATPSLLRMEIYAAVSG